MAKERILVTVKTYPTLSKTYGELVCTAGIRPDGSWIRLYPVPFRRLNETEKYRKYDWIECNVIKHKGDPRPESYRPINNAEFKAVGHIGTADNWRARRELVLGKTKVYRNLAELISDAQKGICSLAVFKPTKVLDLQLTPDDSDWDTQKLDAFRAQAKQPDLFEDNSWKQTFNMIPKLPYKFSYRFEDDVGRISRMRILDWEIGALFWKYERHPDGKNVAIEKVKQQYLENFLKTDLHFFLGTTMAFHNRAPNPWLIIGVMPIPHDDGQMFLF